MKKILYVQDKFGLGGINRIISVKENYLVNHGYEIHNLCCLYEKCIPPKGMYDEKIKCHYISKRKLDKLYRIPFLGSIIRFVYYRVMFLGILLKVNPDIVILAMPNLEPFSVVLLSFWKKRIMEFHGWYNFTQKESLSFREKMDFATRYRYYKIIALTSQEAKHLQKLTHRQVLYIPNALYFYSSKKSTCESKRIITAARLCSQKNISSILPYWRQIEDKHPDWCFDIFGEGELRQEILDVIQEQQLKKTHLHPYTKSINEELERSSIFVLPSKFEGWGLTLVESMANGVPCVSYDCPYGPSDIIRNGEDGFLTKYMDPQDMIDKVLILIENPEIRKKMGQAASVNIQRFNLDKIMRQWIDIFEH